MPGSRGRNRSDIRNVCRCGETVWPVSHELDGAGLDIKNVSLAPFIAFYRFSFYRFYRSLDLVEGGGYEFWRGVSGDYRSVMENQSTAYDIGNGLHSTGSFMLGFFPGSSLPDVGAELGEGNYLTVSVLLSTELLGPLGKEIRLAARADRALGLEAAKGLGKYDVGAYDALKGRSVAGDGLDIHHAMQKQPAGQVVKGYDPLTAPSISVPRGEHAQIPNLRGEYTGSARDLLARDIRNLRNYTNAPNSSLQELIDLNKQMYPGAFGK